MSTTSPLLPGRLGDPSLTLATDPRLDPRLRAGGLYIADGEEPAPMDRDSKYREIVDFIAAWKHETTEMYAKPLEGPPAGGQRRVSKRRRQPSLSRRPEPSVNDMLDSIEVTGDTGLVRSIFSSLDTFSGMFGIVEPQTTVEA